MINTLRYLDRGPDGVYGDFTFDGDVKPFMVFGTHSYQQADNSWSPIVQPGQYECVRGIHALHDGIKFETFEITGVAGHTGILFHKGNFPWSESQGCTLVGQQFTEYQGKKMVTNSGATFTAWMTKLADIDEFDLIVLPFPYA